MLDTNIHTLDEYKHLLRRKEMELFERPGGEAFTHAREQIATCTTIEEAKAIIATNLPAQTDIDQLAYLCMIEAQHLTWAQVAERYHTTLKNVLWTPIQETR